MQFAICAWFRLPSSQRRPGAAQRSASQEQLWSGFAAAASGGRGALLAAELGGWKEEGLCRRLVCSLPIIYAIKSIRFFIFFVPCLLLALWAVIMYQRSLCIHAARAP